jgi:peptidoglycan/LPS O-acetylase OafA/YrhL
LGYRPEIDGLRAVAVVPVVLFHAGFEAFNGGYVGVDVFFVISGYLITTTLIEDIENGRFSILSFYERRARRILPALFFIMFLCCTFAWLVMVPSQMKDFSQSLVAVSWFASNILFWRETDYFDQAVELKPLLHTWSLAVEEQYYVLFPVFLILAWRFGKNRVFWLIVIMAAISLLLSEWGWRNSAVANFYLAPTRVWELFAGSIAAFLVQQNGVHKNSLLASLGLLAIIGSIFVYDESTPFPSLYALVPVMGVVLLVLYADRETVAARILSTKGLVGVGLISYSAYLWHQPLFAFAKILWMDLHGALAVVMTLSTIPLAYLSWRFVEKPFRNKKTFSRGMIFSSSVFGIFAFSMFGYLGHTTNGFENRHDWSEHYYLTLAPKETFNDNCINRYPNLDIFSTCRMSSENAPTVALVGDSHSHALYESLAASYDDETIINIGRWSCLPFVNDQHLAAFNCPHYQAEADAFLKSNPQIHTIILSGYWGYLASGGWSKESRGYRMHEEISETDQETFIQNALTFLNKHKSTAENIILIEDVPDLDFAPVRCDDLGVYRFIRSECSMSYKDFKPRRKKIAGMMGDLMQLNPNVEYVQVTDLFCDEEMCASMSPQGSLYSDGDHVSRRGADLISTRISNLINK